MKRGFVLLALVVLVLWLATSAPGGVQSAPSTPAPTAPAAQAPEDQCCLDPNETDPHWECFNNTCLQVNDCGPNADCTTCGCDPVEEWNCISNGGDWNPVNCTCTYGCDPGGTQEAWCWAMGGTWDPFTCTCYPPPCNPGPPEVQYTEDWSDYYCDGYEWIDCDHTCWHYVQYCQDGSVYNQWTECTATCVGSGEYCGDGGGGGGGGGGDCEWYRPDSTDSKPGQNTAPNQADDCFCVWEWGICCDYEWSCWEF
jgi:hypothetical protein